MNSTNCRSRWLATMLLITAGGGFGALSGARAGAEPQRPPEPKNEFATVVQPLIAKYCLNCHSSKAKKGSLDLERFTSLAQVRKDLKPWQQLIEQLEAGEMPPKEKPQPTAEERKR